MNIVVKPYDISTLGQKYPKSDDLTASSFIPSILALFRASISTTTDIIVLAILLLLLNLFSKRLEEKVLLQGIGEKSIVSKKSSLL